MLYLVVAGFPDGLELLDVFLDIATYAREHIQVFLMEECPRYRGLDRGVSLYTEVSSFQGIGIEESCCMYVLMVVFCLNSLI